MQIQAAPPELALRVLAQVGSARSELERAVSASELVESAAPDPTAVATDVHFLP